MGQFLSREEVDKLLGVDSAERVPTRTEINQIIEAVESAARQRNILPAEISVSETNEIAKKIGIKNVKIYSLDEILRTRK